MPKPPVIETEVIFTPEMQVAAFTTMLKAHGLIYVRAADGPALENIVVIAGAQEVQSHQDY